MEENKKRNEMNNLLTNINDYDRDNRVDIKNKEEKVKKKSNSTKNIKSMLNK